MNLSEGIHDEYFEFHTHSFVIKLWLEESASQGARSVWRGHITHVPSGDREYISKLDDIPLYILPYLEDMQVEQDIYWRMKRWLKNRKRVLKDKS